MKASTNSETGLIGLKFSRPVQLNIDRRRLLADTDEIIEYSADQRDQIAKYIKVDFVSNSVDDEVEEASQISKVTIPEATN